MLTSLSILSSTVLLTFLVLYAIDKVIRRFKKIQNPLVHHEQVPAEMEFSQQTLK